jgi:hypothetical protein
MMRPDAWQAEAQQRQALTRAVRQLIFTAHPDRWQQASGVTVATTITQALVDLRTKLEEGQL